LEILFFIDAGARFFFIDVETNSNFKLVSYEPGPTDLVKWGREMSFG
jgi:hypothetical protein